MATTTRKRPPGVGDKRRQRGGNAEIEMLERLGLQCREIQMTAIAAVRNEQLQTFKSYREFRQKVSEFEAFCNIIEGHLKEVVSERRDELEERFYNLWSMIFRPTAKALRAFFDRQREEGLLPLGSRDLLEAELRALEAMKGAVLAPRFADIADKTVIEEITAVQTIVRELLEHATSLPDFSDQAMADAGPADHAASPAMARSAAGGTPLGDNAQVRAVRDFKAMLETYRRDAGYAPYVETDSRALDEIERKFMANPGDAGALLWLRQIGSAWLSRLREDGKELRRILVGIKAA